MKTAALLINEYGDLDTLLERAEEIKQPKRRQTLIDNADQIRLSRQLVTLDQQMELPYSLDTLEVQEPEADDLLAQRSGRFRRLDAEDLAFPCGVRVVHPVIETAALDGVMDLAGPVGRDHDQGRPVGVHRAHFRNRHLKVRQHLQQEGLERLVGPIQLVNQQNRRALEAGLQGLQQWPFDQELL